MNSLPLRPALRLTGRIARHALPLALAVMTATTASRGADAVPAPSEPLPPLVATRLTIDDAIAIALRNNQRIKVSQFDRGISRANLLTAYGRFDPAITFSRSYSESEVPVSTNPLVNQLTKTDNYALSFGGVAPWGLSYSLGATANNERGTNNQFSNSYVTFGGVSVTQPLLRGFGFGTNLADLRIARANRGISDWQHRQTVIDIVTSVIVVYNNLAEAREELRIAQRTRDLAAQLVSENEKRNRVGAISDADVTQARARAATREEGILYAQRAVRDVENQLRELIGESKYSPDGPEIVIDPIASTPPPSVDGAAEYRRALELRPDYQAARLGITKLRAGDAAARNALLPQLDFVGSYGYNGVDPSFAASRAQVRHEDSRAYSAGMVVSVPLTFAQGRGKARAARLALRQSESDLVRLEQDIAVSVASAIGQLETTAKRVEATKRAYELAQQALDAEQKRFRAGTSSTFVVLQLQDYLSSVESNRVRAQADQQRAIANYEREIGTTLQVHHLTVE